MIFISCIAGTRDLASFVSMAGATAERARMREEDESSASMIENALMAAEDDEAAHHSQVDRDLVAAEDLPNALSPSEESALMAREDTLKTIEQPKHATKHAKLRPAPTDFDYSAYMYDCEDSNGHDLEDDYSDTASTVGPDCLDGRPFSKGGRDTPSSPTTVRIAASPRKSATRRDDKDCPLYEGDCSNEQACPHGPSCPLGRDCSDRYTCMHRHNCPYEKGRCPDQFQCSHGLDCPYGGVKCPLRPRCLHGTLCDKGADCPDAYTCPHGQYCVASPGECPDAYRCPHQHWCPAEGGAARCPDRYRCPHHTRHSTCLDRYVCPECYRCPHPHCESEMCSEGYHCPHEPTCKFRYYYPDDNCPYAFVDPPYSNNYKGKYRRKNTLQVQKQQLETFVDRSPWNVIKHVLLLGPPAFTKDDPRRRPNYTYLAERRYPPRRRPKRQEEIDAEWPQGGRNRRQSHAARAASAAAEIDANEQGDGADENAVGKMSMVAVNNA